MTLSSKWDPRSLIVSRMQSKDDSDIVAYMRMGIGTVDDVRFFQDCGETQIILL